MTDTGATVAAIKEMVDTARRLGLIWTLRLATVITVGPDLVTAIYDADTDAIDMFSMVGTLAPGERVYVIQVPPAGNFIVGQVHAYESGFESISFTTQTSATRTITFTNPFMTIPRVFTNINSGVGATAGWNSRAFGISKTGFTLFVFGGSSTWSSVEVDWAAFAE